MANEGFDWGTCTCEEVDPNDHRLTVEGGTGTVSVVHAACGRDVSFDSAYYEADSLPVRITWVGGDCDCNVDNPYAYAVSCCPIPVITLQHQGDDQ